MTDTKPTWAIVATVDEPPALVQAFVAWHLALGADAIFIYCDKPDDPVQGMLAHLPQVTVVPCDKAHWLRVGKSRPHRHEVRQVRNARDAYARAGTDWVLHCDADEFLWAGIPVERTLIDASDQTDCVAVSVAERIHLEGAADDTIFAGVFRRPFREPAKRGRRIFGPGFALSYRGLTGHAQGKAFVRTQRPLKLSIHRPQPARSDQDIALARADTADLELLHFEGLTPTFWIYKLARMAHALAKKDGMPPSPHRRKQADALIADPAGALALYRRLKQVDRASANLLKQHRLWCEVDFDPRPAIERCFPGDPVDLSPAAVDLWLTQKKSRILSFLLG